ncbi:hypothetical protein KY362_06875 [Candidatus Woesearchaeota archaeon]|nr:hypothetical protein [Candidatus Woesearchaeota archaeon]
MAEVNSLSERMAIIDKLVAARKISKKLKWDDKRYDGARKRLLKVTVEKVMHINRKYARKPKKLHSKMEALIEKFMQDLKIFLDELRILFEELDELAVKLESEEFDDIQKVEQILYGWINARKASVFTKGALVDVRNEFRRFENTVEDFCRHDAMDDARLKHGKRPKVGIWTRIKSEHSLSRQMRRLIKKAEKGHRKAAEFEVELERQLKEGVTLNFPYMFAKYMHEEGYIEIIMHRVRDDIKQFIRDIHKDAYSCGTRLNPTIPLFWGYAVFQKHRDDINKFFANYQTVSQEAMKFAYADVKDQRAIYAKLGETHNIFQTLMRTLEERQESGNTLRMAA